MEEKFNPDMPIDPEHDIDKIAPEIVMAAAIRYFNVIADQYKPNQAFQIDSSKGVVFETFPVSDLLEALEEMKFIEPVTSPTGEKGFMLKKGRD